MLSDLITITLPREALLRMPYGESSKLRGCRLCDAVWTEGRTLEWHAKTCPLYRKEAEDGKPADSTPLMIALETLLAKHWGDLYPNATQCMTSVADTVERHGCYTIAAFLRDLGKAAGLHMADFPADLQIQEKPL